MANYSYTSNGIVFTIEGNDVYQFEKLANANSSFKRSDIAALINAVEIDWNGAQLKNGSTVKATLNTTGEMLSILQTAYTYATTYAVQYVDGILKNSDGTEIKVGSDYTLPKANASVLGGVMIGSGINISSTGQISVSKVSTSNDGLMSKEDKSKLDGLNAANYAAASHNHDDKYAGKSHNHDGVYATASHNHDSVYSKLAHTHDVATTSKAGLMSASDKSKLDGIDLSKYAAAGHSHNNYALTTHNHDDKYAAASHNHDDKYAAKSHTHDAATTSKAGLMSASDKSKLDGLNAANYAAASHNHDDKYAGKSHNHDGVYAKATHTHTSSQITDLKTTIDNAINNSKEDAYQLYVIVEGSNTNAKVSTSSFIDCNVCMPKLVTNDITGKYEFELPVYIRNTSFEFNTSAAITSATKHVVGWSANKKPALIFDTTQTNIATVITKAINGEPIQVTVPVNAITVPVTGISLDKSSLSLSATTSTATLTATVSPSNATNKTVSWSSSDTSVASISATTGTSITVTAKKGGDATITATCSGKTAQCTVSIDTGSVKSFTISPTTASVGYSGTETVTITPSISETIFGSPTVTWSAPNGGKLSKTSTTGNTAVTFTAPANSSTSTKSYTVEAQCAGFSTKRTCTITVAAKPEEKKYYWYVGQENPASMTSISPIVDDNTSPGWRYIGTSLPEYSKGNMMFDDSNATISFGARNNWYIAIPNKSTAIVRDGLGNDGTTVDICTKQSNITINNVEYKVFKSDNVARSFSLPIY